jgi:hypothetical protein
MDAHNVRGARAKAVAQGITRRGEAIVTQRPTSPGAEVTAMLRVLPYYQDRNF